MSTRLKIQLGLCLFLAIHIILNAAPPYKYFNTDPEKDPLDAALEALDLDRKTCVFPLSGSAVASDKRWEIPAYRSLLYQPLDIPYFMGHLEYNHDSYNDNDVRMLIFMSNRAGTSIARGYFSKPLRIIEERLNDSGNPMSLAMEEISLATGNEWTDEKKSALEKSLEDVPEDVKKEAARLLITSAQAFRWQQKSLVRAKESRHSALLDNVILRLTPQPWEKDRLPTISEDWERDSFSDLRPLLGLIDYRSLMAGALDLMISLSITRDYFMNKKVEARFNVELETPLGWVVLRGAGEDNKYLVRENHLLIMDFGGNDYYDGGGANESPEKPIAILLDFEGDDIYQQTDTGLKSAFGSGVLGYGFLFDFSGNDKYICPQLTQGSGYFGVGWLVDYSGDDIYESWRYSQGFAHGGVGFLYDLQGDDLYYCYNMSQGCGSTRGCGMLVDEKGRDQYIAEDEKIRFPSAQTSKHNRSIVQGAGIGDRKDEIDGVSLPGGMGVLIDKEGNDVYSAGVFAQGIGYWSAVGLLIDSSGNDDYRGAWYVQGAGIHGGIGALLDRDGNDSYTATLHASQGLAHDNAIAFFVDEKGNDLYKSPRLSLGTANANSLAFFVDMQGNDRYQTDSLETLGRAQFSKWGTLRENRLNVGIFIDAGGEDQYNCHHGRNNHLWLQQPSRDIPLKSEKGVGIDGNYKSVDIKVRPLTKRPPNVDW